MFNGECVVLGVSGSIAAYRAAEVVGLLKRAGARVRVVMTPAAAHFVAPLTLRVLSETPVLLDQFAEPAYGNVNHVTLAKEAAALVVAPATADLIGRLAAGLAGDELTATVLATKAPVLLAPAMNVNMYHHPAVQANLRRLREFGYHIIEPASGHLACGDQGEGRLAEPETIVATVARVVRHARGGGDLGGLAVLVTAGGTREALDPVRYLGNRSSGKMGYAVAQAARERGAAVTLVSAPTALEPPLGVRFLPVESSAEMASAVLDSYSQVDLVVKAAAVADFRPVRPAAHKIKKEGLGATLNLELEPTQDILAELGRRKEHQVLIGFAAETENLEAHAAAKVRAKNLDLLVANDVTRPGAGFGSDTNVVTLFHSDGSKEELPCLPKDQVAHRILDAVLRLPRLQARLNVKGKGEEQIGR